jgi:type I restriction enzyme, R subunit
MTTAHINNHAGFIWSVADLLRGDYKQSEYGKVILPLTVLRRLDCVLEPTKKAVLDRYAALKGTVENLEPVLCAIAREQFYNTSPLDFRNEAEDIQRAFEPWYEQTAAIPTDPNLLWDAHARLMDLGIIHSDEVTAAVQALIERKGGGSHGAVYAALDPARQRFASLDDDEQAAFREELERFVSLYSFIAQVVSFTDAGLERDYLYCRALADYLPDQTGARVDIGSAVTLTHLRTEVTSSDTIVLNPGAGDIKAIFDGHGKQYEAEEEQLSEIVRVLNGRFGLDLNERDQLLFDQFEETWVSNPDVTDQARNNTLENFRLVFDKTFLRTVIERMDANQDIFARILNDRSLQLTLMELYGRRVYERARTLVSASDVHME